MVEEDKLQSIYEIEDELIRKFTREADIAWEKQQQCESEDITEREHVDTEIKHTKKDQKRESISIKVTDESPNTQSHKNIHRSVSQPPNTRT